MTRTAACLALAFALPCAARAAAWEPYLEAEAYAHSQPVPVMAYTGDWHAPLSDGSNAVTHDRIEAGVRHDQWSLAYVQTYEYEIKANRDAAVLYHQIANRETLAPGSAYALDVRAYHFRAQGLRGAWSQDVDAHQFGRWTLTAGLSLLQGQELLDGSVHGNAVAVAAKDYDYTADVSYAYSEDALFDRPVNAPAGAGFSFDFSALGHFGEHLRLGLQARDAFGRMFWNYAPNTAAVADSSNKQFGSDGYVRYNPVLTGHEGNGDYTQRIHPKGRVWLEGDYGPYTAGVDARLNEVEAVPGLYGRRALGMDTRVGLDWLPTQNALGLSLGWRQFSFGWLADRFKFDDARVLQITLSAGWVFGQPAAAP